MVAKLVATRSPASMQRARGFFAAPDDGLDEAAAALVEQGGELVDLAVDLLVGGGEAGGDAVAGLDERARGFLAAADDHLDDVGAALVEGLEQRVGAPVEQGGELAGAGAEHVVEVARALFERIGDGVGARPEACPRSR